MNRRNLLKTLLVAPLLKLLPKADAIAKEPVKEPPLRGHDIDFVWYDEGPRAKAEEPEALKLEDSNTLSYGNSDDYAIMYDCSTGDSFTSVWLYVYDKRTDTYGSRIPATYCNGVYTATLPPDLNTTGTWLNVMFPDPNDGEHI
jgi:hypothetical protein